MKIKTKLALFFTAVVLVPNLILFFVSLFGGSGLGWVLVALLVSLPVALGMAWFVSSSFSSALQAITESLKRTAEGAGEVQLTEDVYQAAAEYGELAQQVSLITGALRSMRTDLESQIAMLTTSLNDAMGELAQLREQAEHNDAVMVERESRMIELKTALREAKKRLGEDASWESVSNVSIPEQQLDAESNRAAMINILEDLAEEKKMLATEKAKDDAIFRSIGDGLAVADARGNITYMNDHAKDLLGLPNLDVSTDVWSQIQGLFDPHTYDPLSPDDMPLKKALKGNAVEKQVVLLRNDAVPTGRYLSMTATPIIVAGVPMGAVTTFRDMTKEQEVDRAKTEFVSLASHQLRTPLSSINWYTEMLLAGDAGAINDEQKQYLDEVYHGTQRMVDLINALLNVSRLELGTFSVDPKDTDVLELVKSVLDEQMPTIRERTIQLSTDLSPHTPHLFADPKLLRMVFQNLVSNAVKYTPLGGSVSVRVAPVDEHIEIVVADTGLGIPKDEQSKIFSKLYRASNARESDTDGTGLGLYIVKSVVEHSGGTIRFESEQGKGTTFFVSLPKTGMLKKEGSKSLS